MIILLAEIVGILDDIHSKGIADRYLKPENLMISKNDHLKLIDYGTSVMVHETKQLLNVCKNTNQSIPHSKYKKHPSLIGILQFQQLIKEYAVEYELQAQYILKCLKLLIIKFDGLFIDNQIQNYSKVTNI